MSSIVNAVRLAISWDSCGSGLMNASRVRKQRHHPAGFAKSLCGGPHSLYDIYAFQANVHVDMANRFRLIGCSVLPIVMLAPGCQPPDTGRAAELESFPARRLVGIWDVSLHLATPFPLANAAPRTFDVTGTLALVENHYGEAVFGQKARPLHYGSYDLNLTAFGLDPSEASDVPIAIAQAREVPISLSSGSQVLVDSVEIVLNPEHLEAGITLHGQFQSELVIGTWSAPSRHGTASGSFTMSPHR